MPGEHIAVGRSRPAPPVGAWAAVLGTGHCRLRAEAQATADLEQRQGASPRGRRGLRGQGARLVWRRWRKQGSQTAGSAARLQYISAASADERSMTSKCESRHARARSRGMYYNAPAAPRQNAGGRHELASCTDKSNALTRDQTRFWRIVGAV